MGIVELKEIAGEGPGLFYHLTDAQLRSKQEPEKGIFIAEGPKVVHTALDHGYLPVSLLMRKKFVDQPLGLEIMARCGDIPVYTAEDDLLADLTGFKLQRSWVLCAMRRPAAQNMAPVLQNAHRVAVLEELCIVSGVTLEVGDDYSCAVEKAAGEKCPRCWNYRDLGDNANHPAVCGRCGDVLDAIGFEEGE